MEIFSTINFQPGGESFFDFLAELAENMRNEFPAFSSCAINANKVVKLEMVLSNFQTYAFYPETLLNDKNVAEFLRRNSKELSIFQPQVESNICDGRLEYSDSSAKRGKEDTKRGGQNGNCPEMHRQPVILFLALSA